MHHPEIKLRVGWDEYHVLSSAAYEPLLRDLVAPHTPLLQPLQQLFRQRRADDLGAVLARVAASLSSGQGVALITALVVDEIRQTSDPSVLFRGNSLASKSLDQYQQLLAGHYLMRSIGPQLGKILRRPACELDPSRAPSQDKGALERSVSRLSRYAKDLCRSVFDSIACLPAPLSAIYRAMREEATLLQLAHPECQVNLVHLSISSFFFLRLICPAILNPKLFGLASDHPSQAANRTCTFLAKLIQTSANLVVFKEFDPMFPLNPLVADLGAQIQKFVGLISNPQITNLSSSATLNPSASSAALIHHEIYLEKDLCLLQTLLDQIEK